MAKYKVITIAVAVKNNRVAKFGEEVDDSELTVNGNALVLSGSLELIGEEVDDSESQQITGTEEAETETETETEVEVEVEATEEKVDSKKAKTAAEKVAEKNK